MEKEFIPYEQALALKELGFDEEICFGRWTTYPDGSGFLDTTKHSIYQGRDDLNRQCLAPLYQQAFRWFREKYDLVIEQCVPFQRLYSTEDDHFEILEFGYRIYSFDQFRGGLRNKIEWDGYDNSNEEEAELECLKKLIEIVKSK
jgi:hypothetical protein